MASDVVAALTRFGRTLVDSEVDGKAKLKVLKTLNDVTLTLNELSQSGLGRAVRRLKGEPGDLGLAARDLIIKWKTLLDKHIKLNNIIITANEPQVAEKRKFDEPTASSKCKKKSRTHHHHHQEEPEEKRAEKGHRQMSIDSSSGFSFEQVLCVPAAAHLQKKKKVKKAKQLPTAEDRSSTSKGLPSEIPAACRPSRKFTEEILSSLSEDMDRPDIVAEQKSSRFSGTFEDDPDDGNLKFKSKQIIWAPRVKKIPHPVVTSAKDGCSRSQSSPDSHDQASEQFYIPSLIELCLGVLIRNINLIDHVGDLPFELFERILAQTSAQQLSRLEKHNPQFAGRTKELWRRHVNRDFLETKDMQPRYKETWRDMYKRLVMERDRRLDMFINRSTNKLEAEKRNQRRTLSTEVITPSSIRRRQNSRPLNSASYGNSSKFQRNNSRSRDSNAPAASPSKTVFKMRNMSRPDQPPPAASSTSGTGSNGGSGSTHNGMLSKMRKQFLKGR